MFAQVGARKLVPSRHLEFQIEKFCGANMEELPLENENTGI